MGPKGKTRLNHVRTGCLTCKRRRVKCSEERPHCSRCIRGDFLCAGYAVPKAWIFTGASEAQAAVPVAGEPNPGDQRLSLALVHSPLKLGNSDPFDSQSIPIGPRESDLLKVYREFAVRRLGKSSWWNVNRVEAVQVMCLSDKAATLALLSRNAAVQGIMSGGQSAQLATTHLGYLTEAQAALRNNLTWMTGTRTSSMITQVLWTTCLLAYTEIITGSPAAGVHLRAMSQLVVRYVELLGDKANKADIVGVAIIDLVRACMTLTRPTIDLVGWFPSIFEQMWEQIGVCRQGKKDKESMSGNIHQDIKDKRLKNIVLNLREERGMHHELLQGQLSAEDLSIRGLSVHSRRLFQQAQLLHIVLDALDRLTAARLSEDQVHDQEARAYVSLSALLWLIISSPGSCIPERVLDSRGKILQHIRRILTRDKDDVTTLSRVQRNRDARLWTLCIGVHTVLHQKGNLGLELVSGSWFFKAFETEIKLMGVRSWQEVESMSKQFLPIGRVEPHISLWWHCVTVDHGVGRDSDRRPSEPRTDISMNQAAV